MRVEFVLSLVLLFTVAASGQSVPVTVTPGAKKIASGGKLIKKVAPVYPKASKISGIEGAVKLHVIIGKDGRMLLAKAFSGPESLYPAAEEAVKQWVYEPFLLDGVPSLVDATITVNFALTNTSGTVSAAPPTPVSAAPAYSLPPPEETRPRISSGVMMARATKRVNPTYPTIQAGVSSGGVVMRLMIGRDGKVQDVVVVTGAEDLRGPAVEAMRQWEFQPYVLNGEPAEIETVITIKPTFGG